MRLMLDTVIKRKCRNLFVLIFLTVAIAIVLIAYEFHEILAVDSFGENQSAGTAEHQAPVFHNRDTGKICCISGGHSRDRHCVSAMENR